MKIFKWFFVSLFSLILIVLAIALLLPNDYAVSRSITIKASPDKIYPLIAAPKAWKNWSVWNRRDPAMQMSYSGPDSGNGAGWDWQSKSEGNGGMKFTQEVQNQKLHYELHFEGMGKPSTGAILLEVQGSDTKITWSMQGSSEGNLMMKLFAPFMDKMVGPDFQAGLNNLKQLVEKN